MGEERDDARDAERERVRRPARRVRRRRPEQTRDDTDRGWGEGPGDEDTHDRWLQEQRPPHWE